MVLNLALVISGDAAGGKQAAREMRTEVQGLGTDAAATSRAMQAANDQATASARRAIDALTAQTAAERNLRSVIDQRLGISGNVSRIGDPFAQAAGRGADVAAYGQELDRLRARYNPLFAAIQQYRTFQAEIRADYARGVISSEEYAAALSRERQATLANITVLKARQATLAGSGVASSGAVRAAGFSAGQQVQDIGVMAAMGMPISSIAFGQGPQLATAIQQGGGWAVLKEGMMSLVQPSMLITIGLTAAAAAAIKFSTTVLDGGKGVEEVLERHKQLVDQIAAAYPHAAAAAKEYQNYAERLPQTEVAAGIVEDIKTLTAQYAASRQSLIDSLSVAAADAEDFGAENAKKFGVLSDRLQSGAASAYNLRDEISKIEIDPNLSKVAKELVTTLADGARELARIQGGIDASEAAYQTFRGGPLGARNDAAAALQKYNADRVAALRELQQDRDVKFDRLYAVSPVDQAKAARKAEEANRKSGESPEVQKYREDTAAALAYAQAQKVLDDAQKARARSLDQTMASARLDLTLIDQTTAATEAARMQFQLESQIREEAARNNTQVDQAELDRVERLSAAYGELVAAKQAADFIKGQIDSLTNLRLETLLVGQNETVRARAKAELEAELQIRKLGIDVYGERAEIMRRSAERSADLTAELRKQADAWATISDAAGDGIDRLVDSAANGFKDIDDALEEIGRDLLKTSLQMAVGNPLKNWLTGSDLPELGDVKNMGGFLGRLFGRSPTDPAAAVSSALAGQSAAMMNVQAAVVNINGAGLGGGLGDNVSRLLGGANDNYAPGAVTRAPLADIGETAFKAAGVTKTGIPLSQIGAQGLVAKVNSAYADRFQGLLNDLSAAGYPIKSLGEGGYSYRNVAGSSNLSNHAFGNAIDINPRQNPWAVGAKGNFGQYGIDPDALARKNGLFWGGNWNKSDAMHFQVDKTAQSLDKLATSSTNVSDSLTNGLGKLGQSLGGGGPAASLAQLGSPDFKANTTLSAILGDNRPGAGQAAGNGWFGGIFDFIPKLLEGILGFIPKLLQGLFSFIPNMLGGIFSFDGGGYTGAGPRDKPAGVVHKGEIVWSQDDIRNAGGEHVVEAMRLGRRGYASGGVVEGGYPMSARGAASGSAGYVSAQSEAPQINIYPQAGVETKTRKRKGPRGGDVTDIIASAVKQSVADGDLDSTLGGRFGIQPVRARRGTL